MNSRQVSHSAGQQRVHRVRRGEHAGYTLLYICIREQRGIYVNEIYVYVNNEIYVYVNNEYVNNES